MAYAQYARRFAGTSYGTVTKSIAEWLIPLLPWAVSSVDVTSDTTSKYEATYHLNGFDYVKIHIYNSSSNAYLQIGVAWSNSGQHADVTINLAGATAQATVLANYIFVAVTSENAGTGIGKLTSIVDGSTIETYCDMRTSGTWHAPTSVTAAESMTIAAPSIGSQANSLPGNTYFVAEGTLYTASYSKAPYLINGHGPYKIEPAGRAVRNSILSNGTDTFFVYGAGYAVRV